MAQFRTHQRPKLSLCCAKLEDSLKHEDTSDIDRKELFSELKVLRESLPQEINNPIEVLKRSKWMGNCFPNASIAHRVLYIDYSCYTIASEEIKV
ncbi:hypothetical protein RHMOL_Rhmol08G0266900 [Rhododendron molle]|uniref:Uncharacterized protein n=1 Tax=Rhododendron molle TaxID=49168 RepID=A0ACC0MUW8_RHOML|nr:hypothetical protein RHMOL_Rhmol08G0266900 [Rhododendron molle]